MKPSRPITFLFAFFFFAPSFFAQKIEPPTIVWRAGDASRDIRAETLFFEDSTFEMTAEAVLRQPFGAFPMERDWMARDTEKSRFWLLFALQQPPRDSIVFFLGRHCLTQLYRLEAGRIVLVQRDGLFNHGNYRMVIEQQNAEKSIFLASVENRVQPHKLEVLLFEHREFERFWLRKQHRTLPQAFFICFIMGALMILAAYMFVQFCRVREAVFLWYTGYLTFLSFDYWCVLERFPFDFFGKWGIPNDLQFSMQPITHLLIGYFYLKFLLLFLPVSSQTNSKRKLLELLSWATLCIVFCAFFTLFFVNKIPSLQAWIIQTSLVWIFLVGIISLGFIFRSKGPLVFYAKSGMTILGIGGCIAWLLTYFLRSKSLFEMASWQSPWYFSGSGVLLESLCFALGLGEKSRLLAIEKRQAEQKLSGLRGVVAQDLHDDLGSEMSSLSLAAFAAAKSKNPEKMAATLETMAAQSSKLVDEMRDIVWALNPENDSTERLAGRMRAFAARLFEDSETRLHFDFSSEKTALKMEPEARKQLYLFFKETATNAARHASAKNVFVKMGIEKGHPRNEFGTGFLLEIRDDGAGFDKMEPKNSLGGNGLLNLEKRANALGGRLEIESKKGTGTVIRMWI